MAEREFTRGRKFLSRLGRIGSRERVFEREQFFPLPPEQVFAPFAEAGNLQAITPPWLHFRIISALPITMGEGAVIEYRLRLHGMPVRWRTVIETWDPPHRFTDVQERGPFALWHHTHTFEAVEGGTLARDQVRYRVGFGPFGEVAHAFMVGRDVERIFDFRRTAILELVGEPDLDSAAARSTGAGRGVAALAGFGTAVTLVAAGLLVRRARRR
jgi:ligand-binding SRPBCC domain-containing protein